MATAYLPARKGEPQHEQIQLVSFYLGGEEYAVEVLKVREIIRMAPVTHLPNTPPSLEGIINLRGDVIPVVSLRRRFNLGDTEHDEHSRIMVMDIAGTLLGFIVDGVTEVIRISSGDIKPPPAISTSAANQEFICGVIQRSEQLLLLLELDRMFSSQERHALLLTMDSSEATPSAQSR